MKESRDPLKDAKAASLRGSFVKVLKNYECGLWGMPKGKLHIFWINSTSFGRYCKTFLVLID